MAPRETPKPTPKSTPKAQRSLIKKNINKAKSSPVSVKKTMASKKIEIKVTTTSISVTTTTARQRTRTVPNMPVTPKMKDSKPVPGNVTKSAKKPAWNRTPKPAHSGVPVPEKMKKLSMKPFIDCGF